MSGVAYAVMILLFLGAAVLGVSGCAVINPKSQPQEVNVKSQPQEVKAFFVAANEANFLGLRNFSPKSMDLSAYAQQMGVKYPRTFQVDVLSRLPSRPYKPFAVLESEPLANPHPEEWVEKLKDKAREIGADAIVLSHASPGQGAVGMPPAEKIQAVAIKYVWTRTADK
jgi:hypothetical protein